jgi:Na+-transporting methylmalonyl-CoA/oxaloacetate decarboxylase beta subunit
LTESSHISLRNTGEMFTTKESLQLLQSRLRMMISGMLCGMSLISLLGRISTQGVSQVSGFAGISTKCASARLITQSKASI